MAWWQIALIVYFGINFIIATGCTIIFWREGYYDDWDAGKTCWGKAILVFVGLLLLGLPVAIVGMAILTFEG